MKKPQKSLVKTIMLLFSILLVTFSVNCFWLIQDTRKFWLIPVLLITFLLANIMPIFFGKQFPSFQIRVCHHGVLCLKIFLISSFISVLYHIVAAFYLFPARWTVWMWSAVVCICAEAVVFWNGIISVYCSSIQLGIKYRVIGILLGWIPIANLVALASIIRNVSEEVNFETQKAELNLNRHDEQICQTKYPLLLVHGVFFRDFKYLNYWGRIPEELEKNGAQIFYGNHESAASVSDSGEELTARIKEIVEQTNCGKVNIIAHSKGGLDCRYAVSCCGAAPYVASITTINTPHRGCEFADYLLDKLPESMQQRIAGAYNAAMKKLGDHHPDFIAAVRDLTAGSCSERNPMMPYPENIYCQSVGSKLNHAANGKFPLNFTYHLVKYFDGPNDGLVSEKSFRWGQDYTFLTVNGKRGISHGDMIDLNRENIPDFDVREFYVQLAAGLKRRGL